MYSILYSLISNNWTNNIPEFWPNNQFLDGLRLKVALFRVHKLQ